MTPPPDWSREDVPPLRVAMRRGVKGGYLIVLWTVLIAVLWVAGCGESTTREISPASLPESFREGEAKFNRHCARCHGPEGTGTNQGPPLVHKYYEPSHHGDAAFFRAAAKGVRSHHFSFGDMPPLPDVTPEDMTQIVPYIRWLQRQAGIM